MEIVIQFVVFISMILIMASGCVCWLMRLVWELNLLTAKKQVISELKSLLPSIEKDLSFFGDTENQNTIIPPLLRSIANSHELSPYLTKKTKSQLTKVIDSATFWNKALLLTWLSGLFLILLMGIAIGVATCLQIPILWA